MPQANSRSGQFYLASAFPVDAKMSVGTGNSVPFDSIGNLISTIPTLLYKGMRIANVDDGRLYRLKGSSPSWISDYADNRRVWSYTPTGASDAVPALADHSDSYVDDIFINKTSGDVWKKTGTTDFESVYTLSSLISGNIQDTNYYPTTFTWTPGTTSGPTGSLTGEGMTAVPFLAIPSAASDASGIITNGTQTIGGAKTFNSLVTGNTGLTVKGNVNLCVSDTTNTVNIGTGTTAGKITIGGTAGQIIDVGAGGTSTSAKTVNIGSLSGASITSIQSGTGGISLLTATSGEVSIDSGGTGSIKIGINTNGKSILIGNATSNTGVTITSGTNGITASSLGLTTIGSKSDISLNSINTTDLLNVNILKTNTNGSSNIYLGNSGNVYIGSDISDVTKVCEIYKTTKIGSNTNKKGIYVTGFARAGIKTYSTPTSLRINLSDGNTHYCNNETQTSLVLSIVNPMSDLYNNYNGGSFVITIKNSHVSNSDLTVTLSDTEFYGFTLSDTVVLAKDESMTYSGIVQGTSNTDCYLYGIIAPSAQNLMS